jgi:hypothetical protein|tara:strand:- start:7 stop:345 length:339 start_codon:yes stop_codon:yes gene_type:complete
MKKFITTLIVVNTILWFGLSTFMSSAKANDYNTAVIGHILTETIKGTDMDEGAIMNAETQRLLHTMSLEIIQVVFNNMPNILDGIAADMRLKADKNYKCSLQPEEYKNKDCK